MRITVRFFAVVREKAGVAQAELELPEGATAGEAAERAAKAYPAVAAHLAKVALAVNREYADPGRNLREGDELALIPAVSGGADEAGRDWLALFPRALAAQEALRFIADGRAGGQAIFLGTTRAQPAADAGRELVALDYEAFEPMALRQFQEMAAQARGKWPIVRLVIWHRTGRVEVGAPSVLIAVCTPHRAEAFEACRWLIDTLKARATIWKKQVWSDGSGSWPGEGRGDRE